MKSHKILAVLWLIIGIGIPTTLLACVFKGWLSDRFIPLSIGILCVEIFTGFLVAGFYELWTGKRSGFYDSNC